MPIWPSGFAPIPNEAWVDHPVEELAQKYNSVEEHGWYDNLNPIVDRLAGTVAEGERFVDYSGGTGILISRLFERVGEKRIGALVADSSQNSFAWHTSASRMMVELLIAGRTI